VSGAFIDGSSFVQDGSAGNGIGRFTFGLDDIGLVDGTDYLIQVAAIANCGGSPCTSASIGTRAYTIECVDVDANSCENGVVMSGGSTYSITNEYASDNTATPNTAGIDCGYSIENNLMYYWCTDASNTEVTVDISNIVIEAGTSVQFAILSDDCGGNFTDIQCSPSLASDQQIVISSANTTASTCYWISFDGNAGTWFTADITLIDAVVLPVTLISFDGKSMGTYNRIEWTTGSEINSSHDKLERSVDAHNWDLVGTLNSAGNSNQVINYYFNDYNIGNSLHYYRLTQYDFDGEFETFKLIVVDNTEDYKNRTLVKKVNMFGQEINDTYRGVVLYVYDDGYVYKTTTK
jgi:hypothetical protein